MDADVGDILAGKYELLEVAGEGGMARVYRASTRGAAGFRRAVAVKRILPALSDNPEFVEMFVEEARVGAGLQHPNIVQVHDFDQDDNGAFFLVMEWVEGMNLLDWSRAHRRAGEQAPWPLVAAICIEVLKALTAAHERMTDQGDISPVYHRDVTPQNVLISVRGTVKLSDLGLARAMDRARITQPHMIKGKISYLAPELTEGADPNPQTDLFSVGVVLWEMLAGEKLFKGENPLQTIRAIRAGAVPPIAEKRPDIPASLVETIACALAVDPAVRFANARSMARALANLLRTTPSSTSAEVIGHSVREARLWLAREPSSTEGEPLPGQKSPAEESDAVTVLDPEEEGHVLLTRRRTPSAKPGVVV